jgi:type VI secretion system protein ImpH
MAAPSIHPETTGRNHARGFVEAEGGETCKTDFFAFVRWIEGMLPEMPRVGASRHLSEDPLIFHQSIHPGFAPSTVKAVRALPERDAAGPVGRMEGYFLGLLGPSGPMPLSLTEYVWSRSQGVPHPDRIAPISNAQVSIHRRDTSLEDFFNIFNHRFISFLYRAWAVSRKAADYDRPEEARFPGFTGSFLGLGMESMRNRLNVADEAVTYFSGHFSNRSRHPEGLAAIAADYFGTTATITENIGNWLDIPPDEQCSLGSANALTLGAGIVIGARIWDRQLRFRLTLGPMPFATYQKLFPGSPALAALGDLVKFYTHRELFAEVQLVLDQQDYPGCTLGSGARLGWSTWLHSSPPAGNLDDFVIELQ